MALKFDRKSSNNIPSKTHCGKGSPGVYCCLFTASQSSRKPFQAVYFIAAGPRTALYFVNQTRHSVEESTSKFSLKFAETSSARLLASPYAKKDDVRFFPSNSFSEKFIN